MSRSRQGPPGSTSCNPADSDLNLDLAADAGEARQSRGLPESERLANTAAWVNAQARLNSMHTRIANIVNASIARIANANGITNIDVHTANPAIAFNTTITGNTVIITFTFINGNTVVTVSIAVTVTIVHAGGNGGAGNTG